MKVGDLVLNKTQQAMHPRAPGLIIKLVEKKCWRTDVMGKKVDWNKVEPEPHAVIVRGGTQFTIPLSELELVGEGG